MIQLKTKLKIYKSTVLPTLLYVSETWAIRKIEERRLESFHHRCLRKILKIRWQDKVTNNKVRSRAEVQTVTSMMDKRRVKWFEHVRMNDERLPKESLEYKPVGGKRRGGRLRLD